jgi:hypothetical protein
MQRTALAMIVPPVAVYRFGAASHTAAPIGVFWLASLVSIFYGLTGGVFDLDGLGWPEILLGITMWLIAGFWAQLVIRGVEHDVRRDTDSTHDQKIQPEVYDNDPLQEVERDLK